jgi:hypothetical protein
VAFSAETLVALASFRASVEVFSSAYNAATRARAVARATVNKEMISATMRNKNANRGTKQENRRVKEKPLDASPVS